MTTVLALYIVLLTYSVTKKQYLFAYENERYSVFYLTEYMGTNYN